MRQMRLPAFSSGIIPGIANFIYPSVCPVCGSQTDSLSRAPFCQKCWDSIKRFEGPSCRICGVPIVSAHADRCGHCLEHLPAYEKAVSFGLYDSALAVAIHHFKFFGVRSLSGPLAELLAFYDTSGLDAVSPVPLTPAGLRNRGFNQALLLAHRLSKKRRLPLVMDALQKVIDTPPQVGLSAQDRAANVKKAFSCTDEVRGLNMLLIDDVMTTGATVNACSGQMLRAGARSVRVLTLARAGMI